MSCVTSFYNLPMKKVIEGVGYDTKKAIFLGQVSSGFSKEDIRWSVTELYRTRSGNYFLQGYGGPGSPYAVWDNESDAHVHGEAIIPTALYDVIAWAEEYLPDEKLKIVLKDIRQEAKRQNIKVPTYLKAASQKLTLRERKARRAAVQAEQTAQRTIRTYIDW